MNPLVIVFLVLLVLSGIGLIIFILMHSGKGTGVSDMIASSMYNSAAGSGIWEKNLDRLTVFSAIVFGVTICILALTFPVGTIG